MFLKLTYVAKNVSLWIIDWIPKDILDRTCTLLFYFFYFSLLSVQSDNLKIDQFKRNIRIRVSNNLDGQFFFFRFFPFFNNFFSLLFFFCSQINSNARAVVSTGKKSENTTIDGRIDCRRLQQSY